MNKPVFRSEREREGEGEKQPIWCWWWVHVYSPQTYGERVRDKF